MSSIKSNYKKTKFCRNIVPANLAVVFLGFQLDLPVDVKVE